MKYKEISGIEAAHAWIDGKPVKYCWAWRRAPTKEDWKPVTESAWKLSDFTNDQYTFRIPVPETEFSFVTEREPGSPFAPLGAWVATVEAAHDALGERVEWATRVPEEKP